MDISKQIESDGTDRMIKLFIFLTLIKWMVVDEEENKIVIYIDEGGQFGNINRKEIIRVSNDRFAGVGGILGCYQAVVRGMLRNCVTIGIGEERA